MPLNTQQEADIKWALGELNNGRAALFQTYADYYNGNHPLLFANAKFLETFGTAFRANTENLCRLPVDILADLLQVEGFAAINATEGDNDRIATESQEIWRRQRMDERSGQIHKNTALFSESYVIVWPDDEGKPTIYPNLPGNVVAQYHAEKLGYIIRAAKYWVEDGYGRMTIYTAPDKERSNFLITRYRSKNKANVMPSGAGYFDLYEDGNVPAEQVNQYEKVPVFRFVNNAAIGSGGESELRDIIPSQDRLNKGLCDLLIASEYSSYPQRYALNIDIKYRDVVNADGTTTRTVINPFVAGPERMWALESVKDGPPPAIGQLSPGDSDQYLKQIDDARMAVARISGIPPHYFMFASGGFPSGESLKTASERLTRKAKDRQASFGNTWADVMRFCLQMQGQPDVELETVWADPTPRLSELESWQAAAAEQAAGGSKLKTLRERGYTAEQIDEAEQARKAARFGEEVLRTADDRPDEEAA